MRKLFEMASVALGRAQTLELADLKREEGQGAVEYALVVLGVATVIGLAVAGFANEITAFIGKVGTKLGTIVP